MINLNKANFKAEVLDSPTPVVVDFYTTTCGPCRILAPTFSKVAEAVTTAKFAKVEPTDAMEVFTEYGVNRVPTLIIFKDGKVVDTRSGVLSEKELTEWVAEKGK